jgi:DNA-binding GntR family transcriptional regulator
VSLHGEILARLRNYIVEGNLCDGARIPERQLCDLFGISRTPLREALKVLASEGLVDLLPNRGARVRELGAHELAELFDIMGGLEALAGRLACEHLTAAEFAEIEDLHHQMYAFYLKREMPDYFRCNQLIHEKIVAAARNSALSAAYASLAGRIRRIRYAANLAQKRDRWGEAIREHEAILDGDGMGDILWKDNSGNVAMWLLNGATPVTMVGLGAVPATFTVAGVGDFNGDRKFDILWRDGSGNTSIWFMNGAQVASSAVVGNIATTWSVVGTGDFDGNGMSDIIWQDGSGNTSVWLMNGAAVATSASLGNVPTTWTMAETGDFDGNGTSDLLWHNNSGETAIWFMSGVTVSSSALVGTIPTTWLLQTANAD